jgi:hypothetical protein
MSTKSWPATVRAFGELWKYPSVTRNWVLVLSEQEGVAWVLDHSRMAWTEASSGRADRVRVGDMCVLYVTRGAYHNPTRDEGQLVALARVSSRPSRLARLVVIADKTFVTGCDLRLTNLLPQREGVSIRPLVEKLSFVKRKDIWGQYFRSALIEVSPEDFEVMAQAVRSAASHR